MQEELICAKCLRPTDTLLSRLCGWCFWESMLTRRNMEAELMKKESICAKCLQPTDTLISDLCEDCYWESVKAVEYWRGENID